MFSVSNVSRYSAHRPDAIPSFVAHCRPDPRIEHPALDKNTAKAVLQAAFWEPEPALSLPKGSLTGVPRGSAPEPAFLGRSRKPLPVTAMIFALAGAWGCAPVPTTLRASGWENQRLMPKFTERGMMCKANSTESSQSRHVTAPACALIRHTRSALRVFPAYLVGTLSYNLHASQLLSRSRTKYIGHMDQREMTIAEAVQHTGLSRYWVWKLVKAGRIQGRKVGPIWLVTTASVDRYMQTRERPGRRRPR